MNTSLNQSPVKIAKADAILEHCEARLPFFKPEVIPKRFDLDCFDTYLIQHEKTAYLLKNIDFFVSNGCARNFSKSVFRQTCFSDFVIHLNKRIGEFAEQPLIKYEGIVTCLERGRWWTNHYHLLIEIMPKLMLLREVAKEINAPITVLISPDVITGEYLEWLHFMLPDNTTIDVVPTGSIVRPDRYLFLPSLSENSSGYLPPEAIRFMNDSFYTLYREGDSKNTHPKHLFISREDANNRRIINESELLSHLNINNNYEAWTPGTHSLKEQFFKMKSVEKIIGPHGAGMTSLLFCENKASVLEIFSGFPSTPYSWLSQSMGHRYKGYQAGEGEFSADFSVDIKEFQQMCRDV